jgi:hypothetical protein
MDNISSLKRAEKRKSYIRQTVKPNHTLFSTASAIVRYTNLLLTAAITPPAAFAISVTIFAPLYQENNNNKNAAIALSASLFTLIMVSTYKYLIKSIKEL